MKEEAPSKKLPPKISGGGATGSNTHTKVPNDEILSMLLRINNLDSISSIKDESLDIDLSACVTIISADPAINANSLSSADFWRVLDESAQNPQLDITNDDGVLVCDQLQTLNGEYSANGLTNEKNYAAIKPKQPNSFSGTFLCPEPPVPNIMSPLKKNIKVLPAEQQQQQQQRKVKLDGGKEFAYKEELPFVTKNRNIMDLKTTFAKNESISTTNINTFTPPIPHHSPVSIASLIVSKPVLIASEKTSVHEQKHQLFMPQKEATDRVPESCALSEAVADDTMTHKCGVCQRDFALESEMKKHLKTHRSAETRKDVWKKCPECGKCLKLGSMWMHRKIHSENKKYGCEICGQKFVQKINLTHHSRVHTSEKPYECPECQKRFQERSHLQRHQKYHAQTRSYRCDKCGKMYKTERCLKVHNLVHLEQRPFACNVCDKSFISNSKLKQHSNIHTGERPFKCNYCPRDFTNFPNWLKHTRRRHKVDHKTGEHLENIPSYCSKKSTKTAKIPKIIDTKEANQEIKSTELLKKQTVCKPQVRRKKKITPLEENSPEESVRQTQDTNANIQTGATTVTDVVAATNTNTGTKAPKIKRVRKQLMPKQVQKTMQPVIKEEVIEQRTTTNFPDLHCLSITSAEELIMEQALEMEECGLYDAPISTSDTDNAISSESLAALHFKIKNEFSANAIKEEDFNRSTLETTPYSTSASVTITTPTTATCRSDTIIPKNVVPLTSLYMPAVMTNCRDLEVRNMVKCETVHLENFNKSPEIKVNVQMQSPQMQQSANHLYMPITMPMMQSSQMLPSVETILFASSANNFYNGKNRTQPPTAKHLS